MHIHISRIIITDNINFMHLYYELIRVILLITGLRLFGSPVGVTDLNLMQNLCLYQTYDYSNSRRSYRTYTYTDLCLFRTLS